MNNVATQAQASGQKVMGFTVVLSEDISEQEADVIKHNIQLWKKVDTVESLKIAAKDVINRRMVRNDLTKQLQNLINQDPD